MRTLYDRGLLTSAGAFYDGDNVPQGCAGLDLNTGPALDGKSQ